MTPELWKTLVGAIVLVLTAVAAYIKMRTDIDKIRTERADTKQARLKAQGRLSDYAERDCSAGRISKLDARP